MSSTASQISAPAGQYEPIVSEHEPTEFIKRIDAIVADQIAPSANDIDQGHYPLAAMRSLGEAGAFNAHLGGSRACFADAISAMQSISRGCGSTGFLTWCHDVCGLYLEQSENPALIERIPAHASAKTFGGTALSNPMKTFAGIETMLLKAEKIGSGYIVNGSLPWVSHIDKGQYCGAIAEVVGTDGTSSHEIMFLLEVNESVTLKDCPVFSGMEGTSTKGIVLNNYEVTDDLLIADPAKTLIAKIRAAFVLLQTGFGTGVIDGSIRSIIEVEEALGHVNQFLHNRPDELKAEFDELKSKIHTLAQSPFESDKQYLIDVLDVRAHTSELALKASQSALLHQGARGYLMSSAPQRRIREAHFVAIVTPAIKHLRSETNRLMKDVLPA
jgi:alkylation response protein AidB-like acyl-CoA dehydrogenase